MKAALLARLAPGLLLLAAHAAALEPVRLSADRTHFVLKDSGARFAPWGFNYLGEENSLLEETWHGDWAPIAEDFRAMRELGANTVRIHLQMATYLDGPASVRAEELERLRRLLDLARDTGLYLDLTGLSCYRLARVPPWLDALSEAERWKAQAFFWSAIARACRGHPAVFCYDLMNEPVIGAPKEGEHPWLTGELGGFHFVQRIANQPGSRSQAEIAEAWVAAMAAAIRAEDPDTLLTVGVIPWAMVWPNAKPVFYAPGAIRHLDFVSAHFYPKSGEIAKALDALKVYDLGVPLVVEETFPLTCTHDELGEFMDGAAGVADGWISHYFGKTAAEHRAAGDLRNAIVAGFLDFWRDRGTGRSAAAEKPNLLLVVADDLGWSDVGWHGGFGKTPVMDRLVREGVELDRHYVQPVCTPTRAALLTGRYPGRFGPHVLSPSNLRALPPGTPTLASALKAAGYRTHQTGKWHLGAKPDWIPNAYGFDTSYGTLTGAADPWTHKYRKGSPYEDTWHRDGKFFREAGNATELVAAEAVRRIEQPGGPWFVYVAFHAVHTPVDAPEPYKRLYDGVRFHADPEKQDSRLRLAAMVSQLDAKIGEFEAAIARAGQRDNTLIVFTSDNGGIESLKNAYVGEVGHSPLNSENDPLRGQKGTLFEGGTRVCAFAHWPGRLQPRKLSTPLHAVDWFPTVAGLTGSVPNPAPEWDGLDRWKTLATGEDPGPREIYIAAAGGQALHRGDWKLIQPRKGDPMLFNLADDPYEKEDLAAKQPQRLADLAARLAVQRGRDASAVPADLKGVHD